MRGAIIIDGVEHPRILTGSPKILALFLGVSGYFRFLAGGIR